VLIRYGIAVGAIVAAIAFRLALTPLIGGNFPLATMFTAVAFTVWRAGVGPAVFTTIAGWAASGVVFRGGLNYFGGMPFAEVVGFLTYLLATLPIVAIGGEMRRAQREIEERHEELSTTNLELENRVEAQSLLAAIVASSEDAIISKTLDGIITSWNRGAERLFGWRPEEVVGQSINVIVPPELREQELRILEQLRSGKPVEHLEIERLRKDGSRVQVAVTISPVYDRHGHIIGSSKTARDITARKVWESDLVRSEEAQRLLVGIHDATRGIADPAIVMREIVTRVGIHFDVIRCAYGEVADNQQELLISRGYTKDVATVAGLYALEAFGSALAAELKAGRTTALEDVRHNPLTATPKAQATYAAMQVVSMIVAPLVRSGKLVAILVVCDNKPRAWTENDARLLEQVAERTLFAVESARAEASLRENRDALTQAMTAGRMGAWRRDLVNDTIWWSPELARILGFDPDRTAPSRALIYERCDTHHAPRIL
jgi:PAS domain S-box-containing protein